MITVYSHPVHKRYICLEVIMNALNNIFKDLQNKFFNSIVSNRLVYNTCWEDPRIDRQLLQLDRDSEVVMLSSAGCNALDYLLDNPKRIHCVDANPSQNALLELKMSLYLNRDYSLLWNMFGKGYDDRASILYRQKLAGKLSPAAVRFWDRHINYFSRKSSAGSFYFRGTSGKIALMVHHRIKHKGVYSKTLNLLDAKSLQEQTYYFEEIEKQLWSAFYKWLIKRNTTMALLGVPASQRNMIDEQSEGGLLPFIQRSLRKVFTEQPIRDNYFWRVYLTGSYIQSCCPNYLKQEYFNFYETNISKIKLHTTYLTDFLINNPGSYSHFILLDHQDWMANSYPEMLRKEWLLLLKNSRPGAKILFRSAGNNRDFLPDFITNKVIFHSDKTKRLHLNDRVGTYGSTYLAEVK